MAEAYSHCTLLNSNAGKFLDLPVVSIQKSALLDSKYFTGTFTVDVNYTQSNHHPIDNTVVGSTALARDREFTVSFLGYRLNC